MKHPDMQGGIDKIAPKRLKIYDGNGKEIGKLKIE